MNDQATASRSLSIGVFCLTATSSALAQEQAWEQRETGGVFFGVATAAVSDLDGDRIDDVVVGDYWYRNGSGGAFAYSGKTGLPIRTWVGPAGLNGLGRSIAGLGDVDGDGFGDVAISAFWEPGSAGAYVGGAHVYSGASGAELWSRVGEGSLDSFGALMSALDDVTGDGVLELVVGAPLHDGPAGPDSGRVYVLDGSTGALLWTADGEAGQDRFGTGLGSAGDFDCDGLGDVVVGAPQHDGARGKAYVLSGADGALLYDFAGSAPGDELGKSVSGVGDVLPGGCAEILVGAPGFDGAAGADSGRVSLHSRHLESARWSWEGDRAGMRLGTTVASAGDVNRDRTPDLLLGATHGVRATVPGEVWLLSGETLRRLWSWRGAAVNDQFGYGLTGGSDLDGDGSNDVVVGAYQDLSGAGNGRAAVFSGNDLFLEGTPDMPAAGEVLRLHTRGGKRNARASLYVVEIGGSPVRSLVGSARLDGNGEWAFEVTVPPGLSGLEARFQSVSRRSGELIDSNATLVRFR